MYEPYLRNLQNGVEMISSFKGYENNAVIDENAFSFTENTSSDNYPVISPRSRRLLFSEIRGGRLNGLYAKDKMVYINNGKLYYGGRVFSGFEFPDIKQNRIFVSLGAKLLIFPDKVYVNTADLNDYGSLEATFKSTESVTVKMCKADGTSFGSYRVTPTMPTVKTNGALWYDTSGDTHSLKQYSESLGMWVNVPDTYIMIACKGIGVNFNQYDAVEFKGMNSVGIKGKHIIREKGDNYVIISGILKKEVTLETSVTLSREIPNMDFLCESGNRIWGCCSSHNEIYASKLGDPTNFEVFMGLSTDSYAASVGTDGPFTAATAFRGYVLFFKENCVHKIYGQNPPFTITTSYIRGVQKGSHKSLVCLNETLYYKSPTGICTYEGSVPVCISSHLGNEYFIGAVAGALGNKYYICMTDKEKERRLFVYDEEKGIWHHEEKIDIREFAQHNSNLYYTVQYPNYEKQLGVINGENIYGTFDGAFKETETEDSIEWGFESGLWGLTLPGNKYYSNISIRAVGEKGASIQVFFEYDSSNVWEKQIDRKLEKTGSVIMPFITPRCDHLRIKIRCKGNIKIFGISRKIERGSELNV